MSFHSASKEDFGRKTSDAEKLLVLRHFREAEKTSLALLQNAVYRPNARTEQQRAACVYLQAIYEQDRYHEGLATLVENYGRLDAIDLEVFLLWVALSLDAGMAQEAGSKLQQYIQLRTSSKSAAPQALSPDELEAAARMYALEALAGEMGQAKEAESWVQERTPWLEPSQRQIILDELRQFLQEQSNSTEKASLQPCTPTHQEPIKSWGSTRVSKEGPLHALEPKESSPAAASTAAADPSIEPAQQLSTSPSTTAPAAASAHVPGASEQHASSSAPASQLASYVPQSVQQMWQSVQAGEGVAGLTQGQTIAAAAGAAVLLYAGMAERRAVYAGMRRAGVGLWTSIAEVARVAFQLNPNPVAASVAPMRY